MRCSNVPGFSLIELALVLSVISILIGIAFPAFQGMQNEGRATEALAELRVIQTAIDSFFRHSRHYPDTITDDLTQANPRIMTMTLDDPFKTDTSVSPPTYGYQLLSGNRYYIVFSIGPNRRRDWSWDDQNSRVCINGGDDIIVTNGTIFGQ